MDAHSWHAIVVQTRATFICLHSTMKTASSEITTFPLQNSFLIKPFSFPPTINHPSPQSTCQSRQNDLSIPMRSCARFWIAFPLSGFKPPSLSHMHTHTVFFRHPDGHPKREGRPIDCKSRRRQLSNPGTPFYRTNADCTMVLARATRSKRPADFDWLAEDKRHHSFQFFSLSHAFTNVSFRCACIA